MDFNRRLQDVSQVFDRNWQVYPNIDDMLRRLYVACSRTKTDLIICYGR